MHCRAVPLHCPIVTCVRFCDEVLSSLSLPVQSVLGQLQATLACLSVFPPGFPADVQKVFFSRGEPFSLTTLPVFFALCGVDHSPQVPFSNPPLLYNSSAPVAIATRAGPAKKGRSKQRWV
eukprot:TRINITY_DN2543_c0_g1_i1.p1 TRINITY_DN2543_c0_g1~~TRINITY_DN2543_c0_g1_i1.p1  ORF type:complete len:121 (+),score=5.24 TRINITY_DN2543_c0_g1_i1:190-552(+)